MMHKQECGSADLAGMVIINVKDTRYYICDFVYTMQVIPVYRNASGKLAVLIEDFEDAVSGSDQEYTLEKEADFRLWVHAYAKEYRDA